MARPQTRPPAGEPLNDGGVPVFPSTAWLDFFQRVSDAAASLSALQGSTSYANDAAAAAGGVALGALYRNGSVLMVRVV